MKNKVIASAPGKLLLFGEHAVVYGHPCIVTAVNQRMYVTVEKNGVDTLHLDAPDLGLTAYSKTIDDLGGEGLPKEVRFVEQLYKRFLQHHPQNEGINVTTRSDFSSQFGFGSSSAVTVAFAKALTELYGVTMSNHELFELCFQAVMDVQGVGSGFDLAAAIWGGTLYYKKPAVIVEELNIGSFPLLVGYTGVKADTPTLIRMVAHKMSQKPNEVERLFSEIDSLVSTAKKALQDGDWKLVGALMNRNQELLRGLEVSSDELETLIGEVLSAGAFGAKLSGAGGGDCMIGVGGDVQTQTSNIEKSGGVVLDVVVNAEGVRIEE